MLGFTKTLIKFVKKGISTYTRNLVHITYKKIIICQHTQGQLQHFKLLLRQDQVQTGLTEGNILANDASVATSAGTTQYLVASSPNVNWLVGPPAEGETATGNPTLTDLTVTVETSCIATGTGSMELYQDGNLITTKTYTLNLAEEVKLKLGVEIIHIGD